MDNNNRKRFIKKPSLVGLTVFFFLLLLTQYLSYQRYQLYKTSELRETGNEANAVRERIQTVINHCMSTTQTMGFIIERYGMPDDFDSVAQKLLSANKYIDAIQLVPNGVITHTYPLHGNEAAIGYDILKDTLKHKGAHTAISKKELYFSGPFELRQGGFAVVGRFPVFVKEKFWGFSAVIIRLPTLLKAAGIDSAGNKDFIYQLSKVNAETGNEEFYIDAPTLSGKEFQVPVNMPNGEWKLYVVSKHSNVILFTSVFVILGLLLSLTGGLFAWHFMKQPAVLKAMVKEKIEQLKSSEDNYRTTLERVNDAFVALDKNWRYTYLNDAALATHTQGRENVIGKVIWDVHPEMRGTIFEEKYKEAMQTGKVVEVESYYEPFNTWFLVKVYPSHDGLTIFYKDITAAKVAEQALLHEKNLSDSVINSLPGAFYLYDETGKFLRWNKNFETVTGYTADEIKNMHPLDFFDEDEKQLLTEKIQSVFSKGMDEVEANFLTKARKKIPYYFNGWVTQYEEKTCLLGVGIDITERKKAETELRVSNERFSISAKATDDIIWDWNLKTDHIWWNENFYSVFNFRRDEVPLVIDFWDEHIHIEDRERVSNKIREAISKREHFWTDEYRFINNTGNEFHIYDRAYIMYDNNDVPYRMVGAMINITELKKSEEALLKKTNDLNERIKELNCLYRISEIINKRGVAIELLLQECVSIIPPAYQHPEVACARITFQNHAFISVNFNETVWKQEKEILCDGKNIGKIEVFYTEEMPEQHEGPFLMEERALLDSLARNISIAVERKNAEDTVRLSEEKLRSLNRHLQTVREDERSGIAREIHDELGQQLTALKMDTYWISKHTHDTDAAFTERITGMLNLIDNTVKTVRRISSDLRPGILDDLGLQAAIEWQCTEFEQRTGIACTFNSNALDVVPDRNTATNIFRIYQESLTNIMRHANATKVETFTGQQDNHLVLIVKDNGKGFDINEIHNKNTLGLLGMKERAMMVNCQLIIESEKGKGTTVTLKLPLSAITKPQS
jgi:PAS domain S-box-containing protein